MENEFAMQRKWPEDPNVVKIAVHNGLMHADDVLAAALIIKYVAGDREIAIARTTDMNLIKNADFCLDTLTEYDNGTYNIDGHTVTFLDHHKPEVVKTYENSEVKYAACSYVVDYLVEYGYMDPSIVGFLNEILVKPVACRDNGQDATELGYLNSPMSFVSSMNPVNPENHEKQFFDCVCFTLLLLDNIEEKIYKILEDEKEIKAVLLRAVSTNKRYIKMDNYLNGWIPEIVKYNDGEPKILCAVFASLRGGFNLQMTPIEVGKFDIWEKIPEIIKVGEEGCNFIHRERWLAAFDTMEDAVAAAEKIVQYVYR